jgi:tetratricopeptide (TPR) repeat protein
VSSEDITRIIEERFPGIVLESPVQGWVFLEEYEKGIEEYQRIVPTHATAQDDRWLGMCYFQLADDLKAIELFYRAVARYDEASKINLAQAFMFVERSQEGLTILDSVDVVKLSQYNQVYFYRIKSVYSENYGRIDEALKYAEAAWQLAQGISEHPIIAPQILNQLGILHGRIGRSQRALWFFERSLSISEGIERLKTNIYYANALIFLGEFDRAIDVLNSLVIPDKGYFYYAPLYLRLAEAYWAKRKRQDAIEYFERAIDIALETQMSYEEFYARIYVASILAKEELITTAYEHLARAKVLISDKTDELAHNFRDTLVSFWAGLIEEQEFAHALRELANAFGEMGLLQEQGWVRLHLAELYRQQGNNQFLSELDALQQLAVTLQNNNFLAREWTLVPGLREIAIKTHPKIAGKSPDLLEIYSMGEEKLVLNGKQVNIRMKKAIEIITYFLEHGAVSLKKMLLDIFPDEEPKKARNYFHQFRHEMKERLPQLIIDYDPDERLYSLRSDMDIRWDVTELREGRKMGALGIFLPGSGSDWALMLDHELEPLKGAEEVFPKPRVT